MESSTFSLESEILGLLCKLSHHHDDYRQLCVSLTMVHCSNEPQSVVDSNCGTSEDWLCAKHVAALCEACVWYHKSAVCISL